MKFHAKFEVARQEQFLSLISCCNSLEIRLFYRKLNGRKRGNPLSVFHRNSLTYSNDRRGKLTSVLLKIVWQEKHRRHRITRHCSAKLQTAKQTLTTSKYSIEFTYSDFPCHLKVNRDKLALINCRWKCKNGKG